MSTDGVSNVFCILLTRAEEKASTAIGRNRHIFRDGRFNDLLCRGRNLTRNVFAAARAYPLQIDFRRCFRAGEAR
ncbi:hypothetical protein D3C71_1818650 [compost metagenome]